MEISISIVDPIPTLTLNPIPMVDAIRMVDPVHMVDPISVVVFIFP